MDKPLDFSNTEINKNFEVNSIYLVMLKDGRELSFKVKNSTASSLFGFITNTKNKTNKLEENFIEIPFERIENAKKVYYDPWLTFAIFGLPPLIVLYLIVQHGYIGVGF
ncbi:hypothetical protein [Aquiflexum gelatinilyticum]|uniref:Uncharacterized protein n=1 Tax=Aquiflexum gelatinilyticum TaxID=2961943 RepID=A0A9X2P4M9_9BACT|nr:hypothetical protein [Aquiflexum gelatinilyticum]MCR9015232.1 hypothetical protein [Aquiflexum gelatinilyticum]